MQYRTNAIAENDIKAIIRRFCNIGKGGIDPGEREERNDSLPGS